MCAALPFEAARPAPGADSDACAWLGGTGRAADRAKALIEKRVLREILEDHPRRVVGFGPAGNGIDLYPAAAELESREPLALGAVVALAARDPGLEARRASARGGTILRKWKPRARVRGPQPQAAAHPPDGPGLERPLADSDRYPGAALRVALRGVALAIIGAVTHPLPALPLKGEGISGSLQYLPPPP